MSPKRASSSQRAETAHQQGRKLQREIDATEAKASNLARKSPRPCRRVHANIRPNFPRSMVRAQDSRARYGRHRCMTRPGYQESEAAGKSRPKSPAAIAASAGRSPCCTAREGADVAIVYLERARQTPRRRRRAVEGRGPAVAFSFRAMSQTAALQRGRRTICARVSVTSTSSSITRPIKSTCPRTSSSI